MALTDKQRRFVDAKARGASNKEAAEAAGYAPSTASQAGSRLAKDPEILAAIEAFKVGRDVKAREKPGKSPPHPDHGSALGQGEEDDGLQDLPFTNDPKAWLLALMNAPQADPKLRVEAAKAVLPYEHGKVADQGKKEARQEAAKQAGKGKFSQGKPPLSVVKG